MPPFPLLFMVIYPNYMLVLCALCIVCVCVCLCIVCVYVYMFVWLLDEDENVFFIFHYVNKFYPHFNFNLTNGIEGFRGWRVVLLVGSSCDLDCDERKHFPNGFNFFF